MAYWNRKPRAERPEWPKLVQIYLSAQDVRILEPDLLAQDDQARVVDGGGHGLFVRCFNPASEALAKSWQGRKADRYD